MLYLKFVLVNWRFLRCIKFINEYKSYKLLEVVTLNRHLDHFTKTFKASHYRPLDHVLRMLPFYDFGI